MNKSKGNLIMICGLPGSGKTTLANELVRSRGAVKLCADEWIYDLLDSQENISERDRLRLPVETLLHKLALELCVKGMTVILDNGFWVKEEREMYRKSASDLGIIVELHFMDANYDLLWKRIQKRNNNLPTGTFKSNKHELDEWFRVFEAPKEDELENYQEHYIHFQV